MWCVKCTCMRAKSLQSCPTLCHPMDCSLPGSSVHGILQARILDWVALPSSREIFPTQGSHPCLFCLLLGRQFFTTGPTWEALGLEVPTLRDRKLDDIWGSWQVKAGTKKWKEHREGDFPGGPGYDSVIPMQAAQGFDPWSGN